MSTTTAIEPADGHTERRLTIGAVCRRLQDEFPDISISKIRYLEDQGLLTPKRTQGGYRLFSEEDVERLQTILQLQRDEFLPLRVIRQELSSPSSAPRKRRRSADLAGHEERVDAAELRERAGVASDFVRELEAYGLLVPTGEGTERAYLESDVDIAAACGRLARFGIAPRHLRAFRTSADREASLLEALVAPALRSRNPERRQAGVEDLQTLAELAQELSQLLFWRVVRQQASL
ncbi:MAG: MerR family transcriptional regulator [Actinobacteria bacterium]|nr:MerR family transcriptional regulator [Actinomycetota bacterium]